MTDDEKAKIKVEFLRQAFEESRYHRKFHHTLFTLTVSLYVTLLGFQVVKQDWTRSILSSPYFALGAIVLGFYIVFPLYVRHMIRRYHITIAKLNVVIHHLSREIIKTLEGADYTSKKDLYGAEVVLWNDFLFKKYADTYDREDEAKDGSKGKIQAPYRVGRGHTFFLWTVFSLWLLNVAITAFLALCK